ncbi:MAG: hypothetical protein ACLPKB_04260 [Xanthobacteraceae bacterium]
MWRQTPALIDERTAQRVKWLSTEAEIDLDALTDLSFRLTALSAMDRGTVFISP